MFKTWQKPLHKRKLWKQMSVTSKIVYYMRPFVEQLIEIWLQPLPFPTIFKLIYSGILNIFLLMPIVYPILIVILYYGIVQYFFEKSLDMRFTQNIDLIHFLEQLFSLETFKENQNSLFVPFLKDIYALACCIDYIRLALAIMMG
ncbi:uncharacterized protein LOC106084637 [Stomoxys calcitrans]|uniref:Uncharacterized protein n=1 Tax=Stomoxys calcitrans TaxID=35570 RepID=A0A1I8Q4K8_STOCA|nr:uncharacterized protein LOC106084637 [Stomoxys calcitrans]